ncbi:MAG: thiamine pyrophosphate-binding protein, partial [Pseudomonadota bacterium]
MTMMTGGQALVKSIRRNGVGTIFGLPGVQLYALFDAVYEEGDALKLIHTRHEQGAAYMAFGYSQTTGRVGVCTVVPGPGLLNTGAALCTAHGCNAPVLCVTGQIPSKFIGKGYG